MAKHAHSGTQSILISGLFLSCLVWNSLAVAKPRPEQLPPPPATSEAAVKIFEVAPVQRSAAILMPNAQTPVPPAPLDATTKSEILKSLGGSGELPAPGGGGAEEKPVLEHLLLSARHPYFSEQGFLTLNLAYRVHPETAINFNSAYPGSAGVKMKVEKGRTYLLDFSVQSWGGGTYLLETAGGKQTFEDEAGSKKHILVALKATSSGWTTVRLSRDGTDYHLYSVEIMRVVGPPD